MSDLDILRRLRALEERLGRVETVETPGLRARGQRGSDQTLTNGVGAAISFTSTRWDTGGFWVGGNPTRFTAPLAGSYIGGINVRFASNATGLRQVFIYLNGATIIAAVMVPAVNGADTDVPLLWSYDLAAGDYVEMYAYQTSGGNLAATFLGGFSPEGWIARLC